MSDDLNFGSCSPSDCASCSSGCASSKGGCGSNDHSTITLTMEDDTEVECAILTIFPVGSKEYIALLPLDENGQNQSGEVYLYSFSRDENDNPILANVEDDAEYEKASVAFDVIVQNAREAEEANEPLE